MPLEWLREFKDLWTALSRFYSKSHKRLLLKVSLWASLLSFLEMTLAGVAIPYIQCLGSGCAPVVAELATPLGGSTVPALSLALLILITLKLGVQAILTWSAAHLNQQVQRDTVSELLDGYLHLKWTRFRSHNSTHYFRRCATTAVDAAYVSQQCVTMISSALMLVFLIGLMLWQYPLASLSLGLAFIGLNALIQRSLAHRQNRVAQEREEALQRWSIGMTEAFSSFREIRVYGLERFFLGHLGKSIEALALANKRLGFFPTLPRLILDFGIFSVLLTVVSVWYVLGRPIAELMPQLIFYAIVARAILPAMINLLSTRAVLFGSIINIRLVLEELDWIRAARAESVSVVPVHQPQARFALERATFRHAPTLPPVIFEASLDFEHPSWLAIIGPSGSGKSTLMELLCGILEPQSGRVVHTWPDPKGPRLAYLPQQVALLDGTLFENVVFGYDEGDPARVDEALQLACMDDFVDQHPDGRDAQVGANGARLSGGQRQRLAMARALYRRPDLLLLDEATSGLDEDTETRVFSQLRERCPEMSVVYVTHRRGSLRFADQVLRLNDGQIEEAKELDVDLETR
jgi:ABC-type bacteriocin/lantibiotic exporter with double-glycine peptidase domain